MSPDNSKIIIALYNVILNRIPSEMEVQNQLKSCSDKNSTEVLALKLHQFMASRERLTMLKFKYVFDIYSKYENDNILLCIKAAENLDMTIATNLFFLGECYFASGRKEQAFKIYNDIIAMGAKLSKLSWLDRSLLVAADCRLNGTQIPSSGKLKLFAREFNDRSEANGETLRQYEERQESNKSKLKEYRLLLANSNEIIADTVAGAIMRQAILFSPSELGALFQALMALKGVSSDVCRQFEAALRSIMDQSPQPKNMTHSGVSIINVCGFGYSGSSAVDDFLIDCRELRALRPKEMRDLELPIVSAVGELLKNRSVSNMLSFFFRYLVSSFVPRTPNHDLNLKKPEFSTFELARSGLGHVDMYDYSRLVAIFCERLGDARIDNVRLAFKEFIIGLAGPLEEGTKYLLLNQAPVASSVAGISAFPDGATVIAVHRDPRDQFVDQLRAGMSASVGEFISSYRRKLALYEESKQLLMDRYDFFDVQFEQFVKSEDVRIDLCSSLGLTLFERQGAAFVPEKSLQNMGIYKNHGSAEDIALIERELM